MLEEAQDPAAPVLDRLNFLAITGGNLDEFFMIRVAGLRRLLRAGKDLPDPAGLTVSEQLRRVRRTVLKMTASQRRCLVCGILPELESRGIRLRRPRELPPGARAELADFFEHHVKPVLTPLVPDDAQPFPVLSSGTMAAAARLRTAGGAFRALVGVPEVLERFIPVRNAPFRGRTFVLLEELVLDRLGELFPGCSVEESFLFRVTRDMDFSIPDDSVEDLLQSIAGRLELRRGRAAIRLEIASGAGELRTWLENALDLDEQFCYDVKDFLDLHGFAALARAVDDPALREKEWPPAPIPGLPDDVPVLDALRKEKNILTALPYQSFSPVVRMLEEASRDPDVLAVKQTLYRVSGNSPVVRALRRAAENGKEVTVVVELKARFDERNNFVWARALEESGARVIRGIPGLKVHAKALLVVRRENGVLRRYVHLATGNYNDRTAAVYADAGLFSADPGLCLDVEKLFNAVTAWTGTAGSWKEIRVSPFDLREKFYSLIDREIDRVKAGGPGRIRAKMNSLSDTGIIRRLHRAAEAGVEIDLLVRGICCLRPGRNRKNIRITSIVDRYLEHSRIFEFLNGGSPEYYLSSADWMSRNLDRRVEVLFPVPQVPLQAVLRRILDLHFQDDCKARHMGPSGAYSPPAHGPCRSQLEIWRFFREAGKNFSFKPTEELIS